MESYLLRDFTWTDASSFHIPLCLVCGKHLTTAAMAPTKLKQHLTTNRIYTSSKTDDYFKRLLEFQNKQVKLLIVKSQSVKMLRKKFIQQQNLLPKKGSYAVSENLIMPASKIIVGKMPRQDAVREIKNDPINRHIDDISHDVQEGLCDNSTDLTNKIYVVEFVRFVNDDEIQGNFFRC